MKTYTPPSLAKLADYTLNALEKNYTAGNKERLEAIHFLKNVAAYTKKLPENEGIKILVGAYIFCLRRIDNRPVNEDMGYHSVISFWKCSYGLGSTSYTCFINALGVSKDNALDEMQELTYLLDFYHGYLNNHAINAEYNDKSIAIIKTLFESLISQQFNAAVLPANNPFSKMIPTEERLDECLGQLATNYVEIKKTKRGTINPTRERLAQLASLIPAAIPTQPLTQKSQEEMDDNVLCYSHRIKIGMALLGLYSIYFEATSRRIYNRSELFKQFYEMLNNLGITEMIISLQLESMKALHTFLSNPINVEKLRGIEKELNQVNKTQQYSGTELINYDFLESIDKLVKLLANTNSSEFTAFTSLATRVCKSLVAPVGYGFGGAMSFALTSSHMAIPVRMMVGQTIGGIGFMMVGPLGAAAGPMIGDYLISLVLSRAFSQLFEYFALLAGAGVGKAIGFVGDYSVKGLNEACGYFLTSYAEAYRKNPRLVANIDPRLIQCIVRLPVQVFTEEQKEKLQGEMRHQKMSMPAVKQIEAAVITDDYVRPRH